MQSDGSMVKFMVKNFSRNFEKALRKRNNPKSKELALKYSERFYEYFNAQDFGKDNFRLKSYLNIFLGIACYKIAVENGYTDDEAVEIYDDVSHGIRVLSRKLFNAADCLPNGYTTVKNALADDLKGPSAACWTTEIIVDNDEEFTYKISKCLYVDTCEKYGCKDFCKVFCNHDNWAYGGLKKHVKFIRHSTLVDGDVCYDSFVNTKSGKNSDK